MVDHQMLKHNYNLKKICFHHNHKLILINSQHKWSGRDQFRPLQCWESRNKINKEVGELMEQTGELKKRQIEADIKNKREKTDIYKQIKECYKAKRLVI